MRLVMLAVLVLGYQVRAADSPEGLKKLNVVVLDAHGQPVTDLAAADFQVLDDGKPQSIVFFRFTGTKSPQTALVPREYSNRSATPRPTIVILFDMLNGRLLEDSVIRTEMVDALKNLESSENIYLYLITPRGELFPVRPLPAPDTELKPEAEPWTRQIATILDQAMKPFLAFHQVDELDIKNRYEETLAALGALGGRMTEVTGRKNLVWITHGFPIFGYSLSVRSRVDFTNPLREFYGRLGLAQVLLYPVDQSRRGAGASVGTYSTQTLDEAADLTGGRRLTSDRVSDAIAGALTDSRANYEIAYAMPDQKPDKKRHKIRVTTARKELRVETLQAYYVEPPVPLEDMQRQAVQNAIHSPFDATDIGVRASLAPGADGKNANLDIYIDPADLLLRKSGDNRTGHLFMLVAAYGATGFQEALKTTSFDLNLLPAQLETASHGGLASHQTLTLADSVQTLRVIVYDRDLNATGSIRVPVKP